MLRRAYALAWPAAAQQAILLAVNITDRWLVGHAAVEVGRDQIALQAAQTTCLYLSWMMASLGVVASAGAAALVSRCVGAGDRAAANAVFCQALILAATVGAIGAVIGGGAAGALLGALQLQGQAASYAEDYLRVTFAFLPLQLVGNTAMTSLAAAGDTRTPLWIGLLAALANLPMAWIGFRGLGAWQGLGFAGIAWGTGVSQGLGMLAVLWLLARGRSGLRLHCHRMLPDFALLARLLHVSLPAAVESFSMVAGQFLFLGAVNRLSDAARAAHGIALGLETMAEVIGIAFGVAANVLVGQNLGASRPDEARRGGLAAYAMGATGMSLVGLGLFLFARPLFQVFCPDPGQSQIVDLGVPVLRMAAFSMPVLASCHILAAALRGAGDTRFPLAFMAVGFFLVRLPLTAWLTWPVVSLPGGDVRGFGLGLAGCWLAMQADLWFRGMLLFARFSRGRWQGTRV